MASDNGSIKIGSFGEVRTEKGNIVPRQMVGKRVWYSSKLEFFVIIDENGEIISQFDFKQFEKFLNAGVIVFTNQGVKAHMEHVLDDHKKKLSAPASDAAADDEPEDEYDPGDDGYYDDDYDDDYDDGFDDRYDDGFDDRYDDDFDDGYDDGYDDPTRETDPRDDGYDDDYDDGYDDERPPKGGDAGEYEPRNEFGDAPSDDGPRAVMRQNDYEFADEFGDTAAGLASQKDPTRHMIAFFATTLILSIVAFIIIRYGQTIISSIAPLIS